jgi:glutathione S-transferase
MRSKFRLNPAAALDSREKTVAAMDRLERELGRSGYLVGDSFTVADLTAASLLYPVVRPASFPYPSVTESPESAREFLDSLAARPGGQWVAETYTRERSADRRLPVKRL